ncbi:MAG: DUF5320 domain-containing protein [Firmicutes bacterium]|nr:DUF5320 domain-containing protein [Bacillota bacterium]
MPYGDGTGPAGMGPLSGRRLGFCAGYGSPGYANPIGGRGRRGPGYGRGWGYGRFAGAGMWAGDAGPFPGGRQFSAGVVDEKQMLTAEAKMLQENLAAIQARLKALEGKEDA